MAGGYRKGGSLRNLVELTTLKVFFSFRLVSIHFFHFLYLIFCGYGRNMNWYNIIRYKLEEHDHLEIPVRIHSTER